MPQLNTPLSRIEARDRATAAWHAWAEIDRTDEPSCSRTVEARLHFVRDALAVTFSARIIPDGSTWEIVLTDATDRTLALRFDPDSAGLFDYADSRADAIYLAHLTTPLARIECRDAATCAWHECADSDTPAIRLEHVAQTLRGMGFTVGIAPESDYTVATVFVTDRVGAGIRLEYDPMQDGFDYDAAGDDALSLND